VALLKRVLYVEAALGMISGVALAAVPKFTLVTVFRQVHYPEYAWVRLVGIQAIGLSLLAVLVAQRIEELWWWSWAFAIPTGAAALLFGLNAAFGLHCIGPAQIGPTCPSPVMWWAYAAVSALLTAGFLVGLTRTGRRSFPV